MAYTNSGLATYRRISSDRGSRGGHAIDTITIHCSVGGINNPAKACVDYFATTWKQVSSNYCVGGDGSIGISVDECDRSICSCSVSNDSRAVTIEVASDTVYPYKVTDKAYKATILLCTDICKRNNIPKLLWKNNKNLIGKISQQNMTLHKWFSATACPGQYLIDNMGNIAKAVNNNLAAGVNLPPPSPVNSEISGDGYTYDSSSGVYVPTITVDPSKIYPYIAVLSRNSGDVDFEAIAKGRFTGVLIELGDASSSTIINPKIKTQTSDADKKDVPYGLYLKSIVSSKDAVKAEIKKFSVYIYKFSPKLGIWIDFKFTSDKKVNDSILDAYKEQLELMGFKKKIGIYASKSDLSKISWKDKSEDWYLHLVDHVSATSELDGVLNASFFSSGVT